jgi:hypothetical protein
MRNITNRPNDNSARLYSFAELGAKIAPDTGVVDITADHVSEVNEQDIYAGNLVAATTINLANGAKAKLVKGDRINLIIDVDATGRTVTWGTNIKSSATTLAIAASGKAVVRGIFDGTDLVLTQ